MKAVLLTWALFLLWGFIGAATLRLCRYRWTLTGLLLAPAVGFAAVLVPVYILVRFGVPVRLSGPPVLAGLVAAMAVILWRAGPTRKRARALWRWGRAFPVILVGAFGLTAWPMFGSGLDWVANGNDDMACYCLTATGYRDHGYAVVPTFEDVFAGRDATQSSWFCYILFQVRPSELALAVVSSWTRLSALQVFMPVIVALNLALVAAASGLACAGAGRRAAALTGALMAVSALGTFGVVQQVLGQVGGLALVCAALTLVLGRFRRLPRGLVLRRACTCGLVFAGLLVFYPEVIPVLVIGCILAGLRDLVRRRLDRRHLLHAGAAILVMTVLLPVYTIGAADFMLRQAGYSGTSDTVREIFPYYLTPRGPAVLWGLLPLAGPESAAFQTACIIAGFLLVGLLLYAAPGPFLRRRAFGAALVGILLLVAVLYAQRSAFALFKIAMFIQPFLWAAIATWAAARCRRRTAAFAALLLLVVGGLNARVQFWYVDQSRGKECRVALPLRKGSMTYFRSELARRTAAGEVDRVFLVTENNVLLKLLAAEVRTVPIAEIGYAPFRWGARGSLEFLDGAPWLRLHPDQEPALRATRAAFTAAHERERLVVRDPQTGQVLHRLMEPSTDRTAGRPERGLVVAGVGRLSVFNRYRYPEAGPDIFCAPLPEVRNFAAFCDATGARQHYVGGLEEPDAVSVYQVEQDPCAHQRTFAAVNRAVVLDVINPSPRVRVLVDYTASLKADPATRTLGGVAVIGDQRVGLAPVGSGAARLVSQPLSTQAVGPGRFLVVEFSAEPTRNPNRLSAAEALWGADYTRDRRRLTGHLRDISVLSEEDYAAFRPPESVARFPADLAHPHLEFSGFYEEGWLGPGARVRLTQADAALECVIRGMIPGLPGAEGFRTELTVLLDGTPVERRTLGPGDFEVRAPGAREAGPHWIELRFSRSQVLPAPDGRTATALVRFIGFEPSRSPPPQQPSPFPSVTDPNVQQAGGRPDGWTARAQLWQVAPNGVVVVRGQVPPVPGNAVARTELTVSVDGAAPARKELAPGDFEVRVPHEGAVGAHWVELRFTNTGAALDGRGAPVRLFFLGFEPKAEPAPPLRSLPVPDGGR
jgi:hypothetical protein